MNKYLKGCLLSLGAIVLVGLLFVVWFCWSMEDKRNRADEDIVKYSKECDTIAFITERPSITLGKFHKTEIDQLKFYIIRKNKIVKDTTVDYEITTTDHYLKTSIPFNEFLKTDSIVVETKGNAKRYYVISGFRHYAYLHYGMFGYLGSSDCRFADNDYLVNGVRRNGMLLKENGIMENILPQ